MISPAHSTGPASRPGHWFRQIAGVIFTAALVFAPLNFGSTRAGGTELLIAACASGSLAWAISAVLNRANTRLPVMAVGSVALLLLAALPWLTNITQPTAVANFTKIHFANVVARWPYSIVWRTPGNALAFTLVLAVSILALIDIMRSKHWALIMSFALVSTGVAVGVIALLQNYTHATGIYWRNDGRMPGAFCGTFFHHTAAGAYLNTVWPLGVSLLWLGRDWGSSRIVRRIWVFGGIIGLIVLLAAHGSHVSRFPQTAAIMIAPFLLYGLKIKFTSARRWLLLAAGIATITFLIMLAGRTADISERWQLLFAKNTAQAQEITPPESSWPSLIRDDLFIPYTSHSGWFGDRGEGWRTALRSIADRPWFGHGPGNWMGAASQHTQDPFVRTFFQFLQFSHQDVLQFAVEWGVPATLAWFALLTGGLIAVLRGREWTSSLHRTLGIGAAAGLAAVLLQAQLDFPLQIPAVAFNVAVLSALCWTATRSPISKTSTAS